jgi:hypothetical protein
MCRVLLRFTNSLLYQRDAIVLQDYQGDNPTPHHYTKVLLGLQTSFSGSGIRSLLFAFCLIRQLLASPQLAPALRYQKYEPSLLSLVSFLMLSWYFC